MDELREFLVKYTDEFEADEIDENTSLADLGIDSMKLFSIIADFESTFGVKVSDKQLGDLFSVKDLLNIIENK
ncbi:MAG: acyl carrier protein [Eubacterium sp.]|nr:acyl carrier protein [Eubacterium sp.]